MTESKKTPELRFPGFTEAWEEKKLGEIVQRIIRKNKESLVDHVLTISGEYGLIDQEEYFNKRVASKNLSNYYLIYRDEFAYNKSYSKGYPFGAIKRLKNYNKGVLSSLYICFKSHNCSDVLFLESYFDSDNWHKEIYKIAVEGARNHGLLNVSIEDFFSSKHFIPSLAEQEKIGSFFSSLDKKLDLQKGRLEELKSYKKGMMQRIFDQEIRFKDENGRNYPDWQEKKLGEVARLYQPKNLSSNNMINGPFKVFGANGYIGNHNEYNHEHQQVTVSCRGEYCGNIGWVEAKTWITSNSMVINLDDNAKILKKYLYLYLKSDNLKYLITGSGQPQIIRRDISNHIIKIASLPEQKKIASFLSALDRKIELEEEKLRSYEEFKQGLMQRMFV